MTPNFLRILKADKMGDETLSDKLSPLDFEETREKLTSILKSMDGNPGLQGNLCLVVAMHYKHLAQIDGIKEEASKEMDYFHQEALGYRIMYKARKRNLLTADNVNQENLH